MYPDQVYESFAGIAIRSRLPLRLYLAHSVNIYPFPGLGLASLVGVAHNIKFFLLDKSGPVRMHSVTNHFRVTLQFLIPKLDILLVIVQIRQSTRNISYLLWG